MRPPFTPMATEADLRQVYEEPAPVIRDKAMSRIDGHARAFIGLSPFFCIGTSRAGAMADVSPRGGESGFVHVLDEQTVAFPDRPGNNRLDTLCNLLHTPSVGLLFFVPGFEEMLRLNGEASITVDGSLMERFTLEGKRPRAVVVIAVQEVYLHCTKALKRSGLWVPEQQVERSALPSFGQMLRDQYRLPQPAAELDAHLQHDAKTNLY
jgi:PPOX class probable FMN-dependent enzyme